MGETMLVDSGGPRSRLFELDSCEMIPKVWVLVAENFGSVVNAIVVLKTTTSTAMVTMPPRKERG